MALLCEVGRRFSQELDLLLQLPDPPQRRLIGGRIDRLASLRQHPPFLTPGPLLAYPTLALVLAPIALLAGIATAVAVGLGVLLAYGAYEVVHHLIHLRLWHGGYLAWIQRFHLHHHERRWNRNFGNTSPLWDRLLGSEDRRWRTYQPSPKVVASLIQPPAG